MRCFHHTTASDQCPQQGRFSQDDPWTAMGGWGWRLNSAHDNVALYKAIDNGIERSRTADLLGQRPI